MSDLDLHHATFSFLLEIHDQQAAQSNFAVVQQQFDAYVQAYDPGQANAAQWQNIDYDAVHQWVVDHASTPTEFFSKWALAASAVFFRFSNGSETQTIPDPCPNCWGSTSLEALPLSTIGSASYTWEYQATTQTWVRVCRSNFSLSDPSGSPPASPQIVIGGELVAVVRGQLDYAQETASGT